MSRYRLCRANGGASFCRPSTTRAALIRSQQSSEGSVLAGIIYHMGYVRDQYGVSRALLALGEWSARG